MLMWKVLLASLFLIPMLANAAEECDTIIDSSAQFVHLNDPERRVFCIKPGNYITGLKLTVDGTAEAPRIIRYHNPDVADDVHPVHMTEGQRAVVEQMFFHGVRHWEVDRMTIRHDSLHSQVRMQPNIFHWTDHWVHNNEYLTLKNSLVEGGGGSSGMIAMGGDNLSILNNVIRNTFVVPNMDDHCIVLYGANNKVIGNEIYNCAGDGIQMSAGGLGSPDTIVEYNEMYMTADYRTDGAGNFDPNGAWICAENAIDIKGGGQPDRPVIVRNNLMYGYDRNYDRTCVSGGGGVYPAVSHNLTHDMIVKDNVFIDGRIGWIMANPTTTKTVFDGNLFMNMEWAFSTPPHKAFDNTYINNIGVSVDRIFAEAEEDVAALNVVSGNVIGLENLDKQICFIKHRITNPTKVCLGPEPEPEPEPDPDPVPPPSGDKPTEAEVVDAAEKFFDLMDRWRAE
jgi:hypothetical protein